MIIFAAECVSSQIESITGIKTVALPPYDRLDLPVANHADMLLCVVEDTVFAYKDYIESNPYIFESAAEAGYKIAPVTKECGSKYPHDIRLNILIIGKKAFCNVKYAAEEILKLLREKGYDIINVKQGYACCSTLALDSCHAITADIKLAETLNNNGINTLLVLPGGIELKGYNCGFIGGATGVIGNRVLINGDPTSHDSYEKIEAFIKELGMKIIPISSGRVYDFGGFKVI